MEAECNSPGMQRKIEELRATVQEVKETFVRHLGLPEWILDDTKLHAADQAVTAAEEREARGPLFGHDYLRSDPNAAQEEAISLRDLAKQRSITIGRLGKEELAAEEIKERQSPHTSSHVNSIADHLHRQIHNKNTAIMSTVISDDWIETMSLTWLKKSDLKASLKSSHDKLEQVQELSDKHHHDFLIITKIGTISNGINNEALKQIHQKACTETIIALQMKFHAAMKELLGAGSCSTNEHANNFSLIRKQRQIRWTKAG
ncbi:hypothetical protein SLS58_006518 [Diplodia intermedia]|uniref:Uncharacterized protein n=1 Tax=Diplodia intermedia TaxID=856260 RepID=A0ABR3TMZ2_9PEZI